MYKHTCTARVLARAAVHAFPPISSIAWILESSVLLCLVLAHALEPLSLCRSLDRHVERSRVRLAIRKTVQPHGRAAQPADCAIRVSGGPDGLAAAALEGAAAAAEPGGGSVVLRLAAHAVLLPAVKVVHGGAVAHGSPLAAGQARDADGVVALNRVLADVVVLAGVNIALLAAHGERARAAPSTGATSGGLKKLCLVHNTDGPRVCRGENLAVPGLLRPGTLQLEALLLGLVE